MIGTKFYKNNYDEQQYFDCAVWCNETQKGTIEDKGDYFECVSIPEPSLDEIQARLTRCVQNHLDSKAQELNYDNCLSVCSYVNTGVAKFDQEGKSFRVWRSSVWNKCYEILNECIAGTREIPTAEELISELPELVITYTE